MEVIKKSAYASESYTPVPDYTRVTYNQPHWTRRKEIVNSHPEVKQLHGNDPVSSFWVLTHVSALVGLSWAVQAYNLNPLSIFGLAYFVGAFISHALWVLIHELTHDLVTSSSFANTMLLLVCNVPQIIPSGISFRYYHRIHHSHLNETYGDPDVPLPIEDKVFGHSVIGKATWLSLFSVMQTLRLVSMPQPIEWAICLNWAMNLSFSYMILSVLGFKAFLFLLLSSLLSVGFLLHPLGARWIAEHWSAITSTQETFSYYGSINQFAFNIGYHNEHHDFPGVPWSSLPKVRAVAPEYYEPLFQHKSYIKLLWTFLTNRNFTLKSRVVRWPKGADKQK